jgi:hypothetical protein
MGECSIHGLFTNEYGICKKCETDPNLVIFNCKICGTPRVQHRESYYEMLRNRPNVLNITCIYCGGNEEKAKSIKGQRLKK